MNPQASLRAAGIQRSGQRWISSQNHKTAQRFECQQGVVKAELAGIFQVEHRCPPGQAVNQLSHQGGLATCLAPRMVASEAIGQGSEMSTPWEDHGAIVLED